MTLDMLDDCPRLSNLPAVPSIPGAHHLDPPVLSTSSIGRPSYGFCSSSISTSLSPFFECEEVELDDSGFAGYSTFESLTCASSQSSPYGGDGPAEPVIPSYGSPTLPESSRLAGSTPPLLTTFFQL